MENYKRILKRHKKTIASLVLLIAATSFVHVLAGYSLGWILDAYEAPGNRLYTLVKNASLSLLLWITAVLLDYGRGLLEAFQRRKIKTDLRSLAAQRIVRMDYSEFTSRDSGTYVSWMTNDTEQLYACSFEKVFTAVSGGFSAAFALGVMVLNSWFIGAAAVVLLGLMAAMPKFFEKLVQRAARRRSLAQEESMEAYKDTIMGAPVFYLSNLQQRIAERICASSNKAEQQLFQSSREELAASTAISCASLMSQMALVAAATLGAILGATSVGMALSVGSLCGIFFNGVKDAAQSIIAAGAAKPLWEKFQMRQRAPQNKEVLCNLEEINLQNLSFFYGPRQVLRQKSLCFKKGGKYAIVGESGSGKSTIVKLALGLLPGYEGGIFYNGCEQSRTDRASLYRQISYVDQQVYLFQDTLRFNITLGQPCSHEEMANVIHTCNLEGLVASLPKGLDSVIFENGKNLSGGQRQRIALARGLIRNTGYLILDEGTSALDEGNALDIEQSLIDNKDLTVIFITHNLRDAVANRLTAVYKV